MEKLNFNEIIINQPEEDKNNLLLLNILNKYFERLDKLFFNEKKENHLMKSMTNPLKFLEQLIKDYYAYIFSNPEQNFDAYVLMLLEVVFEHSIINKKPPKEDIIEKIFKEFGKKHNYESNKFLAETIIIYFNNSGYRKIFEIINNYLGSIIFNTNKIFFDYYDLELSVKDLLEENNINNIEEEISNFLENYSNDLNIDKEINNSYKLINYLKNQTNDEKKLEEIIPQKENFSIVKCNDIKYIKEDVKEIHEEMSIDEKIKLLIEDNIKNKKTIIKLEEQNKNLMNIINEFKIDINSKMKEINEKIDINSKKISQIEEKINSITPGLDSQNQKMKKNKKHNK